MKIERLFSAEYPPDFTIPLFSCLTKPTDTLLKIVKRFSSAVVITSS
jgi:hypothetical protein